MRTAPIIRAARMHESAISLFLSSGASDAGVVPAKATTVVSTWLLHSIAGGEPVRSHMTVLLSTALSWLRRCAITSNPSGGSLRHCFRSNPPTRPELPISSSRFFALALSDTYRPPVPPIRSRVDKDILSDLFSQSCQSHGRRPVNRQHKDLNLKVTRFRSQNHAEFPGRYNF